MSLQREMVASGSRLFRYRSFLPLLIVPAFLFRMMSATYIQGSHERTELWQLVCLGVCFLGLAVRLKTAAHVPAGTSGRNTFSQIAETLNTTGIYSVVRHPLYLGNYLIVLGISMFFRDVMFVAIVSCVFALYYERIMLVEESFLRAQFGRTFEDWAASTPAFIPRLTGWHAASLPFSWRSMVRREYTTLFVVIAIPATEDFLADSIIEQRLFFDWRWMTALVISAVVFFLCRFLKKQTSALVAAGR